MNYTKVNLSSLVAIHHQDDVLELIVDRGNELETIAIPAPIEAYEGLQDLSDLVADSPPLGALEPGQLQSLDGDASPKVDLAMKPVDSSMAESVGYDADRQILQIEFKSGAIYRFESVQPSTWQDLQRAESLGRFFNQRIKGSHQTWRKRP